MRIGWMRRPLTAHPGGAADEVRLLQSGESAGGGEPACGLQFLPDHAALVAADLQALLQVGDRVGGTAAEPQRVAEVIERVGVVDLGGAPLRAERLDRALQRGNRRRRLALLDEREALVVEGDRVSRAGGRGRLLRAG